MAKLTLTEKFEIPEIDKLPSSNQVGKRKISNLKEEIYGLLMKVAEYRAKKDPNKESVTRAILLVLGDYSTYPTLLGVVSPIYNSQPIKRKFSVRDTEIVLHGFSKPFSNFGELADEFSRLDGSWLIHIDGTVLGCAYSLETNLDLKFDDDRGLGSKMVKHQASLEHVFMSLHLSGMESKVLRRYKAIGNIDPMVEYAHIKETAYDPYEHIKESATRDNRQ